MTCTPYSHLSHAEFCQKIAFHTPQTTIEEELIDRFLTMIGQFERMLAKEVAELDEDDYAAPKEER